MHDDTKPISPTRQSKQDRVVNSPWLSAKEGALYANDGYRTFLGKLYKGVIRSVRDGGAIKTRQDWIDEYLFSLEGE